MKLTLCLVVTLAWLSSSTLHAQVIRVVPPPGIVGQTFGQSISAFEVPGPPRRVYLVIGMHQGGTADDTIYLPGRVFIVDAATGEHIRTLASPALDQPSSFGYDVAASSTPGSSRLAVSAYGETGSGLPVGSSTGRAYILNSESGEVVHTLAPSVDHAGLNFAYDAINFVPDMNGDGVDEVIAGAKNQIPYGFTYLFDGQSGERVALLESPAEPGVARDFGSSVIGTSDVDDDGIGDFVTSDNREPWTPGSNYWGVIYPYTSTTMTSRGRITFRSNFDLATALDVDGDGACDFVAATTNLDPAFPNSAGLVQVFSGNDLSVLLTVQNPQPIENRGNFGGRAIGIEDLNHDGHADLLIGAATLRLPGTPQGELGEGAVYVYSGATGEPLQLIGPPSGLRGTAFGARIASVPDLNNDGVPEIAVATGENIGPPPYQIHGAVYIIFSCPADWNADGEATSADFFGFLAAFFALAPDADRNRDGFINSQDFFDYITAFFAGCE